MRLRLPKILRWRETHADIDAALEAVAVMGGILNDTYMPREAHDRRVRELIDCNNRELERRRDAQAECARLERDVMRAVSKAHENAGLARAFDWLKSDMGGRTHYQSDCFFDAMAAFVAGFVGRDFDQKYDRLQRAYAAGVAARSKDIALRSTAQSMGLAIKA